MQRLLALGGAAPRRRLIRCGPVRLHVLEQGSGSPLLLLHGGGGGGANWYRLIAPLARDYHVIAPDLPGFGLSDDVVPEPPLGAQAARILEALLGALGLTRISVLGTSFGGLAALRLAQHFPGRVRRLMLMSSAGLGASMPLPVRLAVLPWIGRFALAPSERGTRWLLRRLLTSSPLERAHEDALVAYLYASAAAHRQQQLASLRAFAGGRGQREWCEAAELGALATPTLLLWGARDRFFPVAHARRSLRGFARAELVVVEGAGHSPNWEAPLEVLDNIRRFLSADHE